jgi:hypothetical protein
MRNTKTPTDSLTLYAHRHLEHVLLAINETERRKATAILEAGGAYEVRVRMEINTKPCITLVIKDDECEEHELHTVGGEPDR